MPRGPLRTLVIYENGSIYIIFDTDDTTHLYTIRFNSRSIPHMTVIRALDNSYIVGSATYHATKNKFGVSTASNITLKFPSTGTVSLNKEGGFFSNDKRTMRSSRLGQVYWSSRQVNNPWKRGRLETSFMKMVDMNGKALVEYKDEGHTLKRMGSIEIGVELTQEELDEVVVSGMAMLSEEQTGMRVSRLR